MFAAASLVTALPPPEAQRIGVYVMAAIVGLAVCGLISLAKELRAERASRL